MLHPEHDTGSISIQTACRNRCQQDKEHIGNIETCAIDRSPLPRTPLLVLTIMTTTVRTYDASISIDSDWADFKITSGGAKIILSNNPPSTTVTDDLNTIKWGQRLSFEFESVDIQYFKKISMLIISTLKKNPGSKSLYPRTKPRSQSLWVMVIVAIQGLMATDV